MLPPVVWCGEGRLPAGNHRLLHGPLYVLITGVGSGYVPPGFLCGRTIKNRLRRWPDVGAFHETRRLAERMRAGRTATGRTASGPPSGHVPSPKGDRPGFR